MKNLKTILLSTVILTLAACSNEPALDTTSEETMFASMKVMMADMSPEDQAKFGQKFITYGIKREAEAKKERDRIFMDEMDGMTLDDLQELVNDSK